MKKLHKNLLIATLLASMSLIACAQNTVPAAPASQPAVEHSVVKTLFGQRDPERVQQRMAQRQARHLEQLRTKLKLSAQQESAWTTFSHALPAPVAQRRRWHSGEMAKLSAPQRIERMQSQLALRAETMRQRGDATKAFYAVLSAEQAKVFDQETLPHRHRWFRRFL
jgi:hypothetical protein